MDVALYNMTSIRWFTSMLTVLCENNRILWVFPIESKRSHVLIILFILTLFRKKQKPFQFLRVDEYGALVNSTDIKNLIVDYLIIFVETTGGDA